MPNLKQMLDAIGVEIAAASSFLVELGPLTLSVTQAVEGADIEMAILGRTAGSRIACSPPDGMTYDPTALTIAGPAPPAGEYDIALRETHPLGSNSPRTSTPRLTVSERPILPTGPWSFDSDAISFDRTDVTFDGAIGGGATPTPRAFLSDPFFSDPFFRTGA